MSATTTLERDVPDPRLRSATVAAGSALAIYAVLQILWPAPMGVIVQGLLVGSLSALLALGLALVYRANRIVNFAQADLGAVPATVTILLMRAQGWGYLPSFVAGLVVAVGLGAVVHRLFVKRFFKAPRLILTVVTIGVSQILIAVSALLPNIFVGQDFNAGTIDPPIDFSFEISPIIFRGNDVLVLLVVPPLILGLFAFLRRTAIGIAIQASAENADRSTLLGVPVDRIQTVVWMVAAGLSFVALFLRQASLGTSFGFGSSAGGPITLSTALAAAVIGRLENFGVIFGAALGLGVLTQSIVWDTGSALDAIPVTFAIILAALFLQRRARSGRVEDGEISTWKASATARPIPTELLDVREVRIARRVMLWGFAGVTLLLPWVLDTAQTSLAALVWVYALLGVSLVVLTGWSGQISLGQAAFFGVGGAVGGALSLDRGWDLTAVLLAGGVVGALVAIAVGLPALRIKGLYLAVTTLAFSIFASSWLINDSVIGWVPAASDFFPRRPLFGRVDISGERPYYYLCLTCLGLGLAMVQGLRNSRTGRVLLATRDNERAAQSYGVNLTRAKLTAFAVAGYLAATAGVLYVHSQQALSAAKYTPAESLRVFTMVVIGGVGSVPGAIVGSLYLNGTQWFTNLLTNDWLRTVVSFSGSGLGVILVLLFLPGGLGSVLYKTRDRFLRTVAARHGIAVPSLVADGRAGSDAAGASSGRPALLTRLRAMPASLRTPGANRTPATVASSPPPTTLSTTSDNGAPDPSSHLRVQRVEAGYDGVQVLFGVDIDIRRGEIVALLGTNGAGKSTVLRAVSALLPTMEGSIVFDGHDVTSMAAHEIVGHGLGHVPGGRGVFPGLTVEQNLRMATWLYRRDRDAVAAATEDALERFPILREKYGVNAGDLSGGQQQMLTLAQTFMTKPSLIMIDELSLGLAPVIVEQLTHAVRKMRDEGVTVILVEQSVNVALTMADRAYFLEKGEVRFEGRTADLLDRPDIMRSVFIQGAAAAEPANSDLTTDIGDLGTGNGAPVTTRPVDDPAGSNGSAHPAEPPAIVLSVEGISKAFGGVSAVDDVTFTLEAGKTLGIIGPNGAGKTTVFDLISGFTPLDTGRVVMDGRDITPLSPDAKARLGLGRSFQDARLFPTLTVAETIAVALERTIAVRDPFAAALSLPAVQDAEDDVRRRVEELVELLNLQAYRDKFVGELSTGSRRIVDLACVMAHRPTVLMLDEPSSGIAQRETEALGPLLRRIQADTGASLLVIEHDMPLISSVSDELLAMETGRVHLRGSPQEVLEDHRVVESYLGTSDDIVKRSGGGTGPTGGVPSAAGPTPPAPRRRRQLSARR